MNKELVQKVAEALAKHYTSAKFEELDEAAKLHYRDRAEEILSLIFREAVMPEYGRWRNATDGNEGIVIGALGAVANIACKMIISEVE